MIERRIEGVAVLTFGSELLVEILRAQGFRWYMWMWNLCFKRAQFGLTMSTHSAGSAALGCSETRAHWLRSRASEFEDRCGQGSGFEKCMSEIGSMLLQS